MKNALWVNEVLPFETPIKVFKSYNNGVLLNPNPSVEEEESWGVRLFKLLIWPHASLLHWNNEMNYSEGNVILNYTQQRMEHLHISYGLMFPCVHAFPSYPSCIYVSI